MSTRQEPRRQWNIRIGADLWNRLEQRRLQTGLSRDEWGRRNLEHLLATTTPTPEVLASNHNDATP